MPVPEKYNSLASGYLGLLLLSSFTVSLTAGCASADARREPLLTNPPRYAAWLGEDDVSSKKRLEGPTDEFLRQSYEGHLHFPLSEDWRWNMPDPGHWSISRMELGSPVVSGEHILVGNSRQSGLTVLERRTGRVLQVIPTDGPVQAAPVALEDGWLVVDVFGHLQRLDASYAPVWPKAYDCGAGVFRSPTVDGEQVVVSTSNDQVISVSMADGTWRWSHKRAISRTAQDLAILGAPAAQVVDGMVLQGFSDGFVVALDRDTGAELWAMQVGDGRFPDIQAEVIEHEGLLIAAAFGGPTVAIDPSTQSIRWKAEEGAVSTMIKTQDALYTSSGRGALVALDPDTGTTQWRWEPKDKQLGPPVRVGSSLLVGETTGTLHVIDRYEGTETWRYRPSNGSRLSGVAGAAHVAGRQVLFVSAGGTVHSLLGASPRADDPSEETSVRRDRALGW